MTIQLSFFTSQLWHVNNNATSAAVSSPGVCHSTATLPTTTFPVIGAQTCGQYAAWRMWWCAKSCSHNYGLVNEMGHSLREPADGWGFCRLKWRPSLAASPFSGFLCLFSSSLSFSALLSLFCHVLGHPSPHFPAWVKGLRASWDQQAQAHQASHKFAICNDDFSGSVILV